MGDYIFGDEAENIPTGWVFVNFWETFRKTLYGFFGALLIGVPIGILMGRYRYAKNFFFDFIYLAANVPLIVYAILGLLIFGIGDAGPAFVVGAVRPAGDRPQRGRGCGRGGQEPALDEPLLRAEDPTAMRHIVVPSFAPFLFAGAGVVRRLMEAGGARRDVRRDHRRRGTDPQGLPGLLR